MPKPLAEPAAEEIRRVAFGYRSALGMDPRSFNRLGGNRVRNRQVAMFYRTTGLDLTHPGSPAKAMALEDIRAPRDSTKIIRGERTNLGDLVPRQFLEIIEGEDREPFNEGSGRLELAQSIASKDNPLTARVMVNRVCNGISAKASCAPQAILDCAVTPRAIRICSTGWRAGSWPRAGRSSNCTG